MKKRRLKKKRAKEEDSQSVKVFNEVDFPSSPDAVPTKSTIYCLFCYKLSSIESNGESQSQNEKMATCHRFYKNVSNEKFPFVEEVYGTKCGVCDDCFYVVDNHCKLHFEVECLQLRLRWQLYKLFRVMKYAGRVPSRVKLFKESLMTEKKTNGDSVSLEGVLDFRQKLYDKSSKRLKNKKPRVLLSGTKTTKPKVRSSRQAKNKISQSQGTQTVVEFSDIACNTSEGGSMEIDQQPDILEQLLRSHDGKQSQLEAKKTAKSIEGTQKNNSKICSVCGMRFKRRRNLNLHMKNHQGNEKTEKSGSKLALSKCGLCLGGFSDDKKLLSHKAGSHCTKVDKNASTVTVSEDVEQRNWRFKAECPECGVIFKEKSEEELNTVVKFHLEVSEVHARIVDSWIHVCQFCGIRFQYQCHYKTHLALHERNLITNEMADDVIAEAQGTPRVLDIMSSLTGRRRPGRPSLNRINNQGTISTATSGRRPVGRPSRNYLKNQETINFTKDKSGRKLFAAACKKCGKTFKSWISNQRVQVLLQAHLQSKFHGGDRTWKFCCLVCDRKYRTEGQLAMHLKTNIHISKARKTNLAKQIIKCGKCPAAFLSQVKLKNHKKNAKNFCKKFGKSGNSSTKKLDFNYVCHVCSMYFQDKGHLRKHASLHKADPGSRKEISKGDDEMDTYDDMTGADDDIEIELNNAEQSYPDIGGFGSQSTNPIFKCIICNDLFSSEEILVEHARTKHWPLETSDTRNDSETKAAKSTCIIEREGGVISIKTNRSSQAESRALRQPDSKAAPEPMFMCIVCKKPYYSLNSLNSHMMVAHDIIIRPVEPPPVINIATEKAPGNDDDIEIIENEIEEEQAIQISVLTGERTLPKAVNPYYKDNVDPLEARDESQPQSSEDHRQGKKLMEMKCQVCNKTFMGWSKSYLLATLKEHSELHTKSRPSPVTTPKPAKELQDNSSVPIPLINIDEMADADRNSDDDEDAAEDHIQVRKSSNNPSYAFEGECPKCGKLFYGRNAAHTKQYVQRHLRSKLHGGDGNNYKRCDNCGKRFRTRTLLEEHRLTACEASDDVEIVNDDHGDDDNLVSGRGPGNQLVLREIFKCCHCSKTFSTQEKLASHEGARQCFQDDDESDNGEGGDVDDGDVVEIEESNQEIELSSDSEYSPEYENSVTKRKQLTQVETEIFKCPIENCNTFFTSNEELDCHLAIHVDFACAFCDFRTKHPYDLVYHENTLHTYYVTEQNLKCSRCPEVFDLSDNSNTHRSHFLHEHLGIGAD